MVNEIPKPQNTDAAAAAAAADKARARQSGDAAAAASANAPGAGQPKDRAADAHPATGVDRTGSATGKSSVQTSVDRYLADSGHHPAQDAGRSPAQPHAGAADSRSVLGAPQEKGDSWRALYPELRANLAPYGVTADQARTYAQLANTGTEPGDQKLSLQSPDMQRIGHAVNLLPDKLRLELFAQVAKPGEQPTKPDAARPDAARPDTTAAGTTGPDGNPYRVTIDTGKLSAGQTHFGFDPPLTDLPKGQKTENPPPPPVTPDFFGKNPAREPSDFDKYQTKNAAPGTPGHRTPDAPWSSDRATEMKADIGKLVEGFRGLDGAKKLETAIKENVSRLSPALRNPAVVIGLVNSGAALLASAVVENATQHRPVAGAPEQTQNGPIDPTGSTAQQLDKHFASIGGLFALNQLAGLAKLPNETTFGADFHLNLPPIPPKDATGPRQPSDLFFGVHIGGKW